MKPLEKYCTCGEVFKAPVERRRRQQALISWYDRHSGEGHEDTDAAGAEKARMGAGVAYGREYQRGKR
jgi:hypothetical protein